MVTNLNNFTIKALQKVWFMPADAVSDLPASADNGDCVYVFNGTLKGKRYFFDKDASAWVEQPTTGGGGGSAVWGGITGTLSDQADLQAVIEQLQTLIATKQPKKPVTDMAETSVTVSSAAVTHITGAITSLTCTIGTLATGYDEEFCVWFTTHSTEALGTFSFVHTEGETSYTFEGLPTFAQGKTYELNIKLMPGTTKFSVLYREVSV